MSAKEKKYVPPALREKKDNITAVAPTYVVNKSKKYIPPARRRGEIRAAAPRKISVRDITTGLHKSWKEYEWWPEPHRPRASELKSGIINITIPQVTEKTQEYAGITDMHIHIYRNKNEGSGIRIGYGQDNNRWRLEYEIRGGKGTFYIRNPSGNFVPRHGFSEDLSLDSLIRQIKAKLMQKSNKNVPTQLRNITGINLAYLIDMMVYLMEGIQSQRMYGGKRKTRKRKYKRKRNRKTQKKLKKKTHKKKKYRKKRTKRRR